MKTSRQNHLKVPIITFLVCVIQVNGASLIIAQHPLYPNVSTSASLTCHIPSFTGGAEWLINGSSLTLCQFSICIPPNSTRYQYSANATSMTVKITSLDIALDDTTWTCSHNTGIDIGYSNLTVYQLPSTGTLDINGIDISILYEGVTVTLSVRTGCIHPSDSAYYAVIWKYVEATSAAENNFGTNIIQTITSVGGCQNTYENNLMFNLFLTNDMNTGNTSISISQVKMTFTMAGINFYATKSVAYTVTSDGTAAPTPAPTTPKPGTTTTTTTDTTSTTTTITDTTSTTTTDTTSTTTTTTDTTSTTTTATDTTSTATTELPPNDTNNTSTSKSPKTVLPSNNTDIKVIVPAVVVPCGLLIIVAIVLIVVFCVRRKARKNVRESPDGMAIQDNGNNIDGWKQSFRHGKATDNIDTVYTTPDGFIIYPGPADVSTARSYKDKKYHGVTDQYSRPDPGKHHHQADYIPSTHTSARAYTHRGKDHHVVTDQYSRPYPGNYGNQTAYFPSTYKSARTYAQKGKTYEGHQPASNPMANSRLAYDQPAYYPQTGYYGQSSQDVYYSGGGQHSYGQRSRSHHDNNGRKQHIDYYSQYEMADYGGNRAGYRHTKQNTAFYY